MVFARNFTGFAICSKVWLHRTISGLKLISLKSTFSANFFIHLIYLNCLFGVTHGSIAIAFEEYFLNFSNKKRSLAPISMTLFLFFFKFFLMKSKKKLFENLLE